MLVNTTLQRDKSTLVQAMIDNNQIAETASFKNYMATNKAMIDKMPQAVKNIIIEKAKIKPFQKSVLKMRDLMVKTSSPLEKLFALKDIKDQIQTEIHEFWSGVITDESKLVLTRDELTSIMLFILVKAEIPDLYTQLKLITEFTSQDI